MQNNPTSFWIFTFVLFCLDTLWQGNVGYYDPAQSQHWQPWSGHQQDPGTWSHLTLATPPGQVSQLATSPGQVYNNVHWPPLTVDTAKCSPPAQQVIVFNGF